MKPEGRIEGLFLAQEKRTPMKRVAQASAVAGLPLESLPPGQRLALGPEVVVELTEACVPCRRVEELRPGLLKASWGKRGQLARVLTDGTIHEGDAVRLLDLNPDAPRPIRPRLPG